MKKITLITIFCLSAAAPLLAEDTNILSDEISRVSYAIGMNVAHSFQGQGLEINDDVFFRGFKDEQSGATLLTQDEVRAVLTEFQKTFAAKQQIKNKSEGMAFLAANKNKPGIQTLPVALPDGTASELQYLVLTNGTGATPSPSDTVTVNYRGAFINGTEFDSSYKRGKPAQFSVGGVIPGWTQALLKMQVGSKWQLFIPSELAYGERGRPGIPPNSTLIFDVELLSVQPTVMPAAPPVSAQSLTSDIIKVPSKAEMDKGAKIETIKSDDIQKFQSNTN